MIALALTALLVLQEPPSDERIKTLIDQLAADYEDERVAARKELDGCAQKAEPHLVEGLKKADHRIKKGCLELLAVIKSQLAVDASSGLFRNEEEEKTVRQAAFDYLRATGKLAEDVMIEALDSAEQKWRREALLHLTQCKSEKCAEKVALLYDKDPDKAMKQAAFACLQQIGKPAQPFLLKLLASQDAEVRQGALTGLCNIGVSDETFEPVAKLFLADQAEGALNEAARFLDLAGERSEAIYMSGLKAGLEKTRLLAIDGLQKRKVESALDPIANLFENDPSDTVRKRAGGALKQYGTKAEDAYIRALGNASKETRLLALEGLKDVKGEKPYERIAELFRTDKDADVHGRAWDYILAIGIRAEKELIGALKDENPLIRRQAIEALGKAGSEASIEPIIESLVDLDESVRGAAENALVGIGPKAMAAVQSAAEAKKIKMKAADKILGMYTQEQIEQHLLRLMTKDGGAGWYDGQFADLEKFGKEKALPILLRMATEQFVWRNPDDKQTMARQLAIRALGLWGDAKVADALLKTLPPVEQYREEGDEEFEERVIALYRLGRKTPYETLVDRLKKDAEAAVKAGTFKDAYPRKFSLAHMQSRMGLKAEALVAYTDLIRLVEEHKQERGDDGRLYYPYALYNAACIHSLLGDKEKAVGYLEKSVEFGFRDRDWVIMDRDLDSIRGEEGYKKLLADPKKFEPGQQ